MGSLGDQWLYEQTKADDDAAAYEDAVEREREHVWTRLASRDIGLLRIPRDKHYAEQLVDYLIDAIAAEPEKTGRAIEAIAEYRAKGASTTTKQLAASIVMDALEYVLTDAVVAFAEREIERAAERAKDECDGEYA